MSLQTESSTVDVSDEWKGAILAGIIAAAVMAAIMAALPPLRPVLFGVIPALYGLTPPAPLTGIVLHVLHGAILGLGFLAIGELVGLENRLKSMGIGIAYSIALFVVGVVIIMPLWLQAMGFPNAPSVPNVNPPILLLHVVYGAILGGVFPSVRDL